MKLSLAALALALAASPAFASGPDFSWSDALAAGKTISVNDLNGHITATRVSGRTASVTAVKDGKSSNFDRVRIEATPSADGITICAIWPEKHGGESTCDERGMHGHDVDDVDVNVNFTVQVPDGVNLEVRDVNGGIDATDLAGDADVSTVNGTIHVSTSGICEARTVNGSITAAMSHGSWDHDLRFETVNGSVRLTLPQEVNAELRASSVNGAISSDFPVMVSSGFWKGGQVGGTIGKGGKALRLSTVNGSITITRGGAYDPVSKKAKI